VTPIDLGLKQVSRGLLGTRRVLLEWMQRGMSAAIRGVEGLYRGSAEAVAAGEWETASVWSDDVEGATEVARKEPNGAAASYTFDDDAVVQQPVPRLGAALRPAKSRRAVTPSAEPKPLDDRDADVDERAADESAYHFAMRPQP
jgi:hypothetical protein